MRTEPRHITCDGRPEDGKPIYPADQFIMVSGRITSPYPKQKGEKYAVQWLVDNAIAEAEANKDTFNARQFRCINTKNATTADKDGLVAYLFNTQPAIHHTRLTQW